MNKVLGALRVNMTGVHKITNGMGTVDGGFLFTLSHHTRKRGQPVKMDYVLGVMGL